MRAGVLSLAAFVLHSAAWAQPAPGVQVDEPVAVLIASLSENDRDQAVGQVKGIFLLEEYRKLVETPEAFVDSLVGCDANLEEVRDFGRNTVYRFSWNCRENYVEAWMAQDPEGPLVEVWDVVDSAMITARANRRQGVPPPAPKPLTLDDT